MDQLHTRLDALEQSVQTLHQQARTVTRQLRWWWGTALLLLGLGLISWPLSRATLPAQVNAATLTLEQRVAALEAKLKYLTTRIDSSGRPLMEIARANLRLVNGAGKTETANGLGNLIVGYNETRQDPCNGPNQRTGSHNVVIGKEHNYTRFGGLVVARCNQISGDFAWVAGSLVEDD
jgi:chaperonin cofactor prefoldin